MYSFTQSLNSIIIIPFSSNQLFSMQVLQPYIVHTYSNKLLSNENKGNLWSYSPYKQQFILDERQNSLNIQENFQYVSLEHYTSYGVFWPERVY